MVRKDTIYSFDVTMVITSSAELTTMCIFIEGFK